MLVIHVLEVDGEARRLVCIEYPGQFAGCRGGGSRTVHQSLCAGAVWRPWRHQLAPVEVEGEDSPYQPDAAQSPKMTAPLLDTPRSVQVVPKQVMSDQSASSLQDVLQNSPGITFAAGEGGRAGGDLPVIRGQNAASSLFLDGMRDASMQARDTFNLEQVEIIKGPDSVYSGRGGAGGSINWSARRPRPRMPSRSRARSAPIATTGEASTATGGWAKNRPSA